MYFIKYISKQTCKRKNKLHLIIVYIIVHDRLTARLSFLDASDPKSLHSQSDFQLPLLQTQTQNFPSTSNWNISQSSRDCAVGSLARFHFIVHRREGCSTRDGVLQIKQHAVKFVYNCATWHVFLRPLEIRSDCSGGSDMRRGRETG